MKVMRAWLCGMLVGLIVSLPARRAAIYYSEHSLPEPWKGPKVRVYHGGVEVAREHY